MVEPSNARLANRRNSKSTIELGTSRTSPDIGCSNSTDSKGDSWWWVNVLPERMRRGVQVRLSTGGSQETVYKPAVATAAQLWRIRKRSEMAAAAAAADCRDPLELDYPCDPLDWLTEYTLVKPRRVVYLEEVFCRAVLRQRERQRDLLVKYGLAEPAHEHEHEKLSGVSRTRKQGTHHFSSAASPATLASSPRAEPSVGHGPAVSRKTSSVLLKTHSGNGLVPTNAGEGIGEEGDYGHKDQEREQEQKEGEDEVSAVRKISAINAQLQLPKRLAELPSPLEFSSSSSPSSIGSRPSTTHARELARAQLDALLDPLTQRSLERERALTRSKLLTKSGKCFGEWKYDECVYLLGAYREKLQCLLQQIENYSRELCELELEQVRAKHPKVYARAIRLTGREVGRGPRDSGNTSTVSTVRNQDDKNDHGSSSNNNRSSNNLFQLQRSQTARAGNAKHLENEQLARVPAGKRQRSKTLPSQTGFVTNLSVGDGDRPLDAESPQQQQQQQMEGEDALTADEVLRYVPKTLRKQIEGTPRIKTIKVHNAVACLRVKAVGEVIEKLEQELNQYERFIVFERTGDGIVKATTDRGSRSSLPSSRRKSRLRSGHGLPSSLSSNSSFQSTSNSRRSEDGLGFGVAADEYSHEHEYEEIESERRQLQQQVSVHQVLAERLNPQPDLTLDSEALSEALHDSNKHLTDDDREFLYHILNISNNTRINFKLFCILESLSERLPQLEQLIHGSSNLSDYNHLDERAYQIKHFLGEIFGVPADPNSGFLSTQQIQLDLLAAGLSVQYVAQVRDRLDPLHSDRVEIVDALVYLPLWVAAHQRTLARPLDVHIGDPQA